MKKIFQLFFIFSFSAVFAQSPTCDGAAAMCSGNQGPFINTTGVPSFGNLGCLGSTPNPAWFYMQVGTSGNIDMTLFQTSNGGNPIDVDFILWGPFNSLNGICNNLALYSPGYVGPNNVVDCSYSASATEQVNIPGAVAGQYYMLLVTNFSGQAGTYTLNQIGGTGALSCDIVCGVDLGPDRILCGSATSVVLTAEFLQAPTNAGSPIYSWYFNGVLQYTTPTNTTTVTQSGTWSVSVTRPGCSDIATDDIIVQIIGTVPYNNIGPYASPAGECDPIFDLTSYEADLVAPNDPASFTFEYIDGLTGNIITDPANYTTNVSTTIVVTISAGSCGETTTFDLFVDCVVASCDIDLTSAPATASQSICIGNPITDITYQTAGDATNAVATGLPAGLTTSYVGNVLTITGTPTVLGTFNYTVETAGCSPELNLSGSITINPNPTFTSLNANGPICAGENAIFTLSGTPGASVFYTNGSGPVQFEVLDASGDATITIPNATSDVTITLNEIELGTCDLTLTNTATVVISPTPDIPTITVTPPTCSADGFSTITNYDATLTYTFTPTGPTIDATGLVLGMTFGTSYTVTAGNGTCTSLDSSAFSNTATLSVPSIPVVSVTAPTCLAAGFATITNYDATMTYVFTPVGPTVDASGLISGMAFATSYEVLASNGSCSSANSAAFTIQDMLVTPAVPTISETAPTCSADGFSTITNYDATLTYTFTPTGPTIDATGLVLGMTFGTSYTVTAGNGTCTSLDSSAFSNTATLSVPSIPIVSVTSPTCLAAGFATITNYDATMTYVFTPVGPTVDAAGLISGMAFATSYEVLASNGSCSSANSAAFTIQDMLVTPAVPTISETAPTCSADGFSTITNYDATLTYTFTPVGPTVDATGLISGMTLNTMYEVTASNATCTSTASAQFSNLPMLVTPVVPIVSVTAPTCLAAGFATITNYDATMTYVFTPVGPTVDAAGLISGMAFATSYEVLASNGSCSSANSAAFTIQDMLVTPAVPTISETAPTCSADGFSTITNYDATLTYTFTPVGPTVDATGLISGMTLNTMYEVTASNATCTSVASAQFSNLPMLVTPVVPIVSVIAPTCLAAGFATITNYDATMTYVFTPVGPTVDAAGLISGMAFATSYEILASNGSCSSANSAAFTIQDMLVTPAVPTISETAPTCSADGFSTITNYDATLTYTFTPVGPTVDATGLISGMTLNTMYEVTASNATCTSVASAQFSNLPMLVTPVVPIVSVIAPTCLAAGFATITNYDATMTYVFTPVGPTVDAAGLISGMAFATSYEVLASNGSCSSANSAAFTIQDMLVTPAVPTISETAPTCSADGFSTITNYDATLTYTFTPVGPTVDATGLISGMTLNTMYEVTASNATCTSTASTQFSNLPMLVTPVVPIVSVTAPTCLAAGFATITNYDATMTYVFTPVGPTVDAAGLISGMAFATSYEVLASNGSCSSANSAAFTIQDMLVTPAVPTISETAPTCSADGFSTITNYNATLTYTFTPVGPTVDATGLISGMTLNTMYEVTASNATCTSTASAQFSNLPMLVTPVVPIVSVTAPTCIANGFATITNYNAGLTYTFNPVGPTVGAGGLISGMTLATPYTVTAGNGSCTSVQSTSFSISQQLPQPTITSVTNNGPICLGGTATFTINAIPNTQVICSINGNAPQTVSINASGQGVVSVSGVTGSTTLNTVSVSDGICSSNVVLSSTVNLFPNTTISLISAPGTDSQSRCAGVTIDPIQYQVVGTATNVVVTGLPSGITSNYNAATGVVTISGSTNTGGIYNYTITTSGGCNPQASLTGSINVTGLPVLTYSVTDTVCDGTLLDFILNSNISGTTFVWSATVSNISGFYSVTTSGTEADINQIATLNNPETIGTITMTIIPNANGCDGAPRTIDITINPNPVIESVSVSDTAVCSGSNVHVDVVGNISGITYTWTAITSGVNIVGGTTSGTITATSTTTGFDLQVVASNPLVAGTIYFEVSSVRTGCTGNTLSSGVVTVNPNPGLPIPSPVKTICSGEGSDLMIDVSPLIAGTELTWEVLTVVNVSGAVPGSGIAPQPINDILTATTNTQGYVIYRVRSSLGDCQGGYTDYRVNVNPSPRPVLADGNICITASGEVYQTYTLNTGLNDVDYDFEWFDTNGDIIPGATNATLVVDEAGTYSVIATNWSTGCSSDPMLSTATATVTATTPATSMAIVQSEYFSDNATITVTVPDGSGSIMYALDEGSFQSSNVFTGVSAGEHTVTVIDIEGCTYMTQTVMIIDYPTYFTPNGDGINDTWNIVGLNQADAKLYIFDRYGKLLKQLSTTNSSDGWDGTYNQEELPSTDYWFTLDYTENGVPKQFKAHFTMKR